MYCSAVILIYSIFAYVVCSIPIFAYLLKADVKLPANYNFERNTECERKNLVKNIKFYICPQCGNLVFSENSAEISCCGEKLEPLAAQEPDLEHDVMVETVEDEWFITSKHPMEKEHYISMAAFANGERLEIIRTYAEWEIQARFVKRGHGKLFWICNQHGLFSKLV